MKAFGGNTMVGTLRRVVICPPRVAGWMKPERLAEWRTLGHLHAPNFVEAQAQHQVMHRELEAAGAEVVTLEENDAFSLDAVYVHDASLMTEFGAIVMNMGKPARAGEPPHHSALYRKLGIPVLGEISPPAMAEAGDIVWLDARTLLVGRGYRTNADGIEQIRSLLGPRGVEVLVAPLPYGGGPCVCLHLMSLMSLLDERTVLVDLPWLAVETVELLKSRGYRLIEIDPSERDTLACNILSLGGGRLLAFAENPKTIAKLRAAGFDVRAIAGSEIGINGGGGPTCLTRPILRDAMQRS